MPATTGRRPRSPDSAPSSSNLGIEVVAVTDANFKPDKQVSDLETVMSKKPNIIVSLPTDPVATAHGV